MTFKRLTNGEPSVAFSAYEVQGTCPQDLLKDLLEYCRIHCHTERALFHVKHIRRVAELAGFPCDLPDTGFISVGPDVMDPMLEAAQANLAKQATAAESGAVAKTAFDADLCPESAMVVARQELP